MIQVRILFFVLTALAMATSAAAQGTATFDRWLRNEVWPMARAEGISRQDFEQATAGLKPDMDLPGVNYPGRKKTPSQAEFSPPGRYFRERILSDLARIGQAKARKLAPDLARIESRFGVPRRILLAIWGRESGFGAVGSDHDAFSVLATRGFFGPSRDYFTGEFVAAIQLADGGDLRSSWAGALGQPQMMPTSLQAYGADGDRDGTIDIWKSEPDTLASIAKFLADHDWQEERDWGFEVDLPSSVSCTLEGPDNSRTFREWSNMGIKRIGGRPFPKSELGKNGSLLLPAGRFGPAFLVTDNFYVLKRYNRSDLYALFIGNAADRIAYGMGNFRSGWDKLDGLAREELRVVQTQLGALGFDTGGTDGLIGHKTRRAVGAWQTASNQTATCYPNAATFDSLR